jgi:2,3-bisphosphoglycerate-independent phosphoglycerate mutase
MNFTLKHSMKKVLLCILDGFGFRKETFGNATLSAAFINNALKNGILLEASGESVGLPYEQFGNSEVGHLTIGAGRVLKQKLPLINNAIDSGELINSSKLNAFIQDINTCHLLSLFSNGGVHSDLSHLFWAIKLLRQKKISIKTHLFFDGRDVGYKDGLPTLCEALNKDNLRLEEISTIQGRFYGMDRDKRWERTQTAYDLIVNGAAEYRTHDPQLFIRELYDKGVNDETIPPIVVGDYSGAVAGASFWSLNFRVDRVRQILSLLQSGNFKIMSMTNCGEDIDKKAIILFDRFHVKNTLGEVLSANGISQLRIAETEKYAHVTYFLNGGIDVQYELEDRILVSSPKVNDYAKTPGMSAHIITSKIVKAIKESSHQVIIANFANADMVGHTGDFNMTQESLRLLDNEIQVLANVAQDCGYIMIITADHGNAEEMINIDQTPNKTHTCSKVPFICLPQMRYTTESGGLVDVAPTILKFLKFEIPTEMTGISLVDC